MIGKDKITSIPGATVLGSDGEKIGTVGQLYVDAHSGEPSWVSVKTGLFGRSESFIPLEGARADGDRLHVGFDKGTIKDAPRIDTDGALSPAEEDELYRYYGITPAGGLVDTTEQRQPDLDTDRRDAERRDDPIETEGAHGRHRAGDGGSDGAPAEDPGPRPELAGAEPDGSVVRSEEQLRVVGTERVVTGKARLRKYTVTTNETITVPVQKEHVELETVPAEGGGGVADNSSEPEVEERRDGAPDQR